MSVVFLKKRARTKKHKNNEICEEKNPLEDVYKDIKDRIISKRIHVLMEMEKRAVGVTDEYESATSLRNRIRLIAGE